MPPEELLNSVHASLDSEYCINKHIIPPLERILNLVGVNVRAWYDEMARRPSGSRSFKAMHTLAHVLAMAEIYANAKGIPIKDIPDWSLYEKLNPVV
ncbi:hypothetical protein B0H63DRAFT_563440 [Podospora didyma]|uniref:DNA-directed DNA polymerase n=1 Tax=Podospora didyma TaxID=330526 RepID=A0AAE0N5Y2_9PEZI|nr:hypothetical protein B0H63DRAFT_563440 [Podospora didyma]